jgi:hypothetical protein
MKAVTQATKEIEAKISDDVWARQRRWELRRDILLQTMDEITNMQGPFGRSCGCGYVARRCR